MNYPVTIYKVELGCSSAPGIGCGSRSKPILLELEKCDKIYKTYLYSDGSKLAILWNKLPKESFLPDVLDTIAVQYKTKFIQLPNSTNLFNATSSNWLEINQLDSLSEEEAKITAAQILSVFKRKSVLSQEYEKLVFQTTERVFLNFFLDFEDIDQLSDTKEYKRLLKIILKKLSSSWDTPKVNPTLEELLKVCKGHY
jgi:hypothetical protein